MTTPAPSSPLHSVCALKTSPCVRSKRSRVYRQHVHMYSFTGLNQFHCRKSCTQNRGRNLCKWRADSMECYPYLRNVQDLLADGTTPCERRVGEPFTGPMIPFGAMIEYYPTSARDQARLHQFGRKVLPGMFLGSAFFAGENPERIGHSRGH